MGRALRVVWLLHMRDMTHLHVYYDSYVVGIYRYTDHRKKNRQNTQISLSKQKLGEP